MEWKGVYEKIQQSNEEIKAALGKIVLFKDISQGNELQNFQPKSNQKCVISHTDNIIIMILGQFGCHS